MPEVPAPPTECWLHPAVTVCSSRIEGRGLIATADLAEGTVVVRLGGRLVDAAEMRRLVSDAGAYVDTIGAARAHPAGRRVTANMKQPYATLRLCTATTPGRPSTSAISASGSSPSCTRVASWIRPRLSYARST